MASSIGVRVYQVSVNFWGDRNQVPFDSEDLTSSPPSFFSAFVDKHALITERADLERSWYFEKLSSKPERMEGYVHYGTFGFESDFIDSKTKKKNYHRKTTDIEEIPLYYCFWFPPGAEFGLAAFQSFQGRSCIHIVMHRLKEVYEAENDEYVLKFKKLMPGSVEAAAPVKKLSLIKRKISGELADRYGGNDSSEPVDIELSIIARRSRNLGSLLSIKKNIKNASGLFRFDGIEFEEAVAEIAVGGRRRKVGVLGYNSDAGVIELTDSVKRGPNGHPIFESISKETRAILKEFYQTLAG